LIGHRWVRAEGTITNSRSAHLQLPGKRKVEYVNVYDIDVRMPGGETFQAQVPSHERRGLHIGTIVRLEVSTATGEIRLPREFSAVIISRGSGPLSVYDHEFSAQGTAEVWGPSGALAASAAADDAAGSIRPSPAARIEALRQMVERGYLTQDDFEVRRQQVLDSG
jgi:hypothetical protein